MNDRYVRGKSVTSLVHSKCDVSEQAPNAMSADLLTTDLHTWRTLFENFAEIGK